MKYKNDYIALCFFVLHDPHICTVAYTHPRHSRGSLRVTHDDEFHKMPRVP